MIVFGIIKSSEVYQEAVARTKANEQVQQLLGTPIDEGLFVTGNIETSNDKGNADLTIPVSGPNGSAVIRVVAMRSDGRWKYVLMEVDSSENSATINLLGDGS